MNFPIVIQAPDDRLRVVCKPVTAFDNELSDLIYTMTTIRRKSLGIGLAAPQIGAAVRVIAINPGETCGYTYMVNPEIVKHGRNQSWGEEGCLSINAGRARFRLKRWDTITVRFQLKDGETVEKVLRGMAARVVQHEIDHLDGKLISDVAQRVAA